MMNEKRKPLFARKPSVVVAIGAPKPEAKAEPEAEGLVCPKCGMQLADSPENREYAASREAEMDDEMEETEEDE